MVGIQEMVSRTDFRLKITVNFWSEKMKVAISIVLCLLSLLVFPSYASMKEEHKDQSTTVSTHEVYLEITDLKSIKNIKLVSDIEDEDWKFLPDQLKSLDISNINYISEAGLRKIREMNIENLNISNLNLHDDALQFLPQGLKRLDVSGNPMGGSGLKHLPHDLEWLNIKNTLIFKKATDRFLSDRSNLTIIQ